MAIAVIGSTPLRGGKATIIGSAPGAVLLGIVSSGLAYFNVPINWAEFATGTMQAKRSWAKMTSIMSSAVLALSGCLWWFQRKHEHIDRQQEAL